MATNLIVRVTVITAVAVAAFAATLPPSAQSLGEAAKQEAARRKAVKGPVKVFTNESLKPLPPDVVPPPAGDAAPPAPPAAGAPGQPAPDAKPAATDPAKGPDYWRQLITDARQERDRNAFLMVAVQSRINALMTDFSARDDPSQRAQIGVERDRTLAELERMKKDQLALEKRIAEIEEEARRANVPAGWLR